MKRPPVEFRRIILWLKVRLADLLCTDAVGRILSLLLEDRIPFRGITIDTRSPVFSTRVKAQLFWRVYESSECRFVKRYLVDTQYAIELGSSLGVISSHLGGVMNEGAHLYCVEANPALIDVIATTMAKVQNEKSLHVEIINAAIVGNAAQKEACLLVGDETVGSAVVDTPISGGKCIVVPAMTLSEVVERSGFPEYVLVADIEGAEIGFIRFDNAALRSCRRMVIELHDTNVDQQLVKYGELLESLVVANFGVIDRKGPVVVLENLNPPPL